MDGIDKQKKYFEELARVIDEPIYATRNWKKGNEWVPGKRHLLAKHYTAVPPIDHRTVGPNEVLLELDAKSYSLNYKVAVPIIDLLRAEGIPYYAYWSGNKSIHIHIFIEYLTNKYTEEELECIKKAYGMGWNIQGDVRMAFATYVIEQAGLSYDLVGHGKIIDLAKLKWNDMSGKATLIRVCGGANIKTKDGIISKAWKTYFEELPKNKPRKSNNFDEVDYPPVIEKHKLDSSFVVDRAYKYVKELTPQRRKSLEPVKFDGEFLSNPCIPMIYEGLEVGKRNQGAKIITIAARMDKKPIEDTRELVKKYVKNCPQVPDPYEYEEAERWIDWIYQQPEPYWNCSFPQQINCCSKTLCPYYKKKYAKELDIFNNPNPLQLIKKTLDKMIVGETSLKMTLFLLYLTKEFDPEWCILLDGPAASGKSHVMKAVANLFGEEGEGYFSYSRLTQSSLNHMEELAEEWANNIVIIEELQGAKAVVEQLRVAISEGKLTLLESVEVKTGSGKEWISQPKEIKFKNVLFVTCNAEDFDEGEQLKSRAWILNTDQTSDQTRDILNNVLKNFSKKNKGVIEFDSIRQGIKLLEKADAVIFPFAEELGGFISSKTVRGRRDVKKLVSLIKSSAFFHQKNRIWIRSDGENILVADWRDVLITFAFAGESLNASTQGVGPKDLVYYGQICDNITYLVKAGSKVTFTIDDVMKWCKLGISGTRKLMMNLVEAGFFENTELKIASTAKYAKTDMSPEYMGDIEQFCKDKIEKQEDLLAEFVNNFEK